MHGKEKDGDSLFATLRPDAEGALDGVEDRLDMPLEHKPERVRADVESVKKRRSRPLSS